MKLVGEHGGRIFDERDVSFSLGEGSDVNIIEGVEKALEKFKKGETSQLKIKSKYAFGSEGSTEFNIPPNADIQYTVTLKSFEKVKFAIIIHYELLVHYCIHRRRKVGLWIQKKKYNKENYLRRREQTISKLENSNLL